MNEPETSVGQWAEEAVRELLADCVEAIVFAMHAELTALVELPDDRSC